jgi:hypothetical protein
MLAISTQDFFAPALSQPASRRSWLMGPEALPGTSVRMTPMAVLTSPVAPDKAPLPAQKVKGGDESLGMVKLLTGAEVPQGPMLCTGHILTAARHLAPVALVGCHPQRLGP